MERHRILGDKVVLYRRAEGGNWHCYTFLNGKAWRKTTRQKNLARAKDFATDWYTQLCTHLFGSENPGKMFTQAARAFLTEYKAMTHGRHGADPLQMHRDRLRLHLLPYFDDSHLSEVTSGAVQQYRAHRLAEPEQDARSEGAPVGRGGPKGWKPPGRKTVEDEIETLRMVLETAQRHGWIDRIPDLSDPYEPTPKAKPKLWFTPWEFRQLCAALSRNAENPTIGRDKVEAGQLRDYVIFMVNTGLTPAEADALQYRDVQVVRDDTDEQVLEIAVHGSDGINYCHSAPAAISAFERMLARNRPRPDDLLFSNRIRKLFNDILKASNLKCDRKGKARTADSLRHSYICFRLLEGVSLHDVAENCRTSVETIEKHYAVHLPDLADALLIDLRSEKHTASKFLGIENDDHRPEA